MTGADVAGEALWVDGVTVVFKSRPALDGFSIHADAGEIVGVFGPSGCGKSTLLRVVAGLQPVLTGVVRVGHDNITALPPHKRRVGLVFQDHQLFSHLDVAGNVGYALKVARTPKPERAARVAELLNMVDLDGFEHRSTNELSGGEAQRVALARSLAASPRVLLMDEPFSALDRELHDRLVLDTRGLLKRLGITALHVTHDSDEAATMCDRVVRMPASERTV
jgi:thiamine transport system ATP-binding protein